MRVDGATELVGRKDESIEDEDVCRIMLRALRGGNEGAKEGLRGGKGGGLRESSEYID
jgi:hypothetical protein